jgi:pimeloyl-ACP methyl ester carboxylesterase
LIWGDKDPVVPLATAKELMRELPSATLSVINSAGHLPYEELPQEFNKTLLGILREKIHEDASDNLASAPHPL